MSALSLWMTGCADDNVLFVTTTNIGIDADARPPHATIGYDRYEGYIGPSYGNGAIPPVFAKIESDLAIFQPKVRQLYATGDAARLVTQASLPPQPQPEGPMFADTSKVMLFGTTANIGLRVTFAGNVPESLSLGYKRKEFSFIPLGTADHPTELDPADPTKKRQVHTYGSVLAAMDMNVHTESFSTTGLGVTQFFATGDAARNLAARQSIRDQFALAAEESLTRFTCKHAPDDTSAQLRQKMNAEPTAKAAVEAEAQSRGVSVPFFLNCDIYASQRQELLRNLSLQ